MRIDQTDEKSVFLLLYFLLILQIYILLPESVLARMLSRDIFILSSNHED